MKKFVFIHLPVAVALAFCFTACSDNGSNSITAPSTMCWDEEWTYSNLTDGTDADALRAFTEANQCFSAFECAGKTMTVHRCVDNVEFK